MKRLGEERGFRATIEDQAGEGRADVVLRKESVTVDVEISITTDTGHYAENISKCLGASLSHVLFVSPDASRRKTLAKQFAGSSTPVLVCGPEELVVTLDAIYPGPITSETTVRGYKVKVNRQSLTPEQVACGRSTVAGVIAKSLRKNEKND